MEMSDSLKQNGIRISKASVLHFMLSATLMVDYINGMWSGFHFGEIFRVILILLCLDIIIDRDSLAKCVFLFLFLSINVFLSFIITQNIQGFFYDVSMALKSTLSYLICAAILKLYRKGIVTGLFIERILKANLIYGPGLFIISRLLGSGHSSYGWNNTSLGFKAQFMSLNSVNAALIVLYIYVITKLFSEKKRVKWLIYAIYVIVPLAMLGTKTGIAIIFLVPVLFFMINTGNRRAWITVVVLIVLILVFYPYISRIINNALSATFERQKWLFQQRDFLTYLFSTRNQRLVRSLSYYLKTFSVLDIFPGRGYYEFHSHIIYTETANVIPIEMDWADILTAYGPVGFIFTYFYSLKQLGYAKGHLKLKNVQMCFWSAIILITFGTLAGHVYLEAISSTFLAVVCGGVVIFSHRNRVEGRCEENESF